MKRRDWGKGVGVDVLEHPPRTVLVIRGKKKFTPTEGDVRPTGLRPTPPLADARVRIHEFEPDPRVLAEGGLDQGGIPPALSCRDCPVDWHLPRSQGHRNGELLKRRGGSPPRHPESGGPRPLAFSGPPAGRRGPLWLRPVPAGGAARE